MPHHTPLIATLVIALVLAFLMGAAANRLRISPIVGYVLAGVLVGPFTPGYVADQALAADLAEIGVILLMFGVGLHFSLKDLLSVKAIAIPGAIAQMLVASLLGMGVAWLAGWPAGAGYVFGLALSVASTVVLTRALQERHLMQTERGRIAVGWLVVQDLAMVLALVLIPALAGVLSTGGASAPALDDILRATGITIAKVLAFVALMLVVGQRVIPEILHYVAHTGSRELFRLAVLSIALGVAYGAAQLFGISFALGAFFAGMILSESTLSQRAAEESLPFRDAFAVLFFVSVGMLFNPSVLLNNPFSLAATLIVVLVCNPVAAYLIVRLFGHPAATALTIGASLAQIGEFSFILAALGVGLKILPQQGQDLILAGAIISILVNPLYFAVITRLKAKFRLVEPAGSQATIKEEEEIPPTALRDHAVVVGFGRVGTIIGERLRREGKPFLVIEERQKIAEAARKETLEVISGNAADPRVLVAANLAAARLLFIAIPDGFEAGQVSEQARRANAKLEIIARAHSDAEVEHLQKHGANFVVMGEREIALGMLDHAFGSPKEAKPPRIMNVERF
ncbi:MAG TPA: YbaL family putative K(+) efflux transporter [Xanthobacteraceae bacterium]|nr:YbaL family putative K(+) efflux transporter [Xanthobacteraceae bacterium]